MQKNPFREVNSLWYSREISYIYGSRQLIIVFTSARRWSQSCARWVWLQTPPSYLFKVPSSVHLDLKAVSSFQVLRISLFVKISCLPWMAFRILHDVMLPSCLVRSTILQLQINTVSYSLLRRRVCCRKPSGFILKLMWQSLRRTRKKNKTFELLFWIF
jgi:hypothetical protein